MNQQSKLSQGSSGSSKNSIKGNSQTSLSEIPLPNKLYSAPPSEYSSSSGTESDASSLEYTPQFRNIIEKKWSEQYLDESESETNSLESETDSEQQNSNSGITKPSLRNERHDLMQVHNQNTHRLVHCVVLF